jgi:hypothetical protein
MRAPGQFHCPGQPPCPTPGQLHVRARRRKIGPASPSNSNRSALALQRQDVGPGPAMNQASTHAVADLIEVSIRLRRPPVRDRHKGVRHPSGSVRIRQSGSTVRVQQAGSGPRSVRKPRVPEDRPRRRGLTEMGAEVVIRGAGRLFRRSDLADMSCADGPPEYPCRKYEVTDIAGGAPSRSECGPRCEPGTGVRAESNSFRIALGAAEYCR